MLLSWLLLWAAAGTLAAGDYCEDFERGELGPFWSTSPLDSRGHWKATGYEQLRPAVPDFPAPADGSTVAYLTADFNQIYVYARLQMTSEMVLPAGSSVSLRYWLRTDYPGSGTLEVRRQVDGVEEKEPLISLTDTSGPNNTQWAEVSVPIPDSSRPQKIIIFGGCATHEQNNIAVDDITICGPEGLNQECNSLTTTTEFTTITEDPTTRWTEGPTTRWTEDPTTHWTPTSPAPAPGEYCDDFESDDFGLFWRQSRWDSGGHWEQSAFSRLRDTVPDFPAPASGDWLVFLTPAAGSSFAAARLQMTAELVFPAGSRLSFRYWLRSQLPAGAALFVKRCVGEEEDREPLLDLSETAAPENDRWMDVSVAVPADPRPAKIIIFGSRGTQPLDSIAIDDIRYLRARGPRPSVSARGPATARVAQRGPAGQLASPVRVGRPVSGVGRVGSPAEVLSPSSLRLQGGHAMVIEKQYKPEDEPDPEPYLFVSLEQKRIDGTKPYDAKTACWVPDPKEGFLLGKIVKTEGDKTIVQMPNFEEKEFKKSSLQQVNPPKFEKCEDMSNLTYLNDASVLHNLKQRYYTKLIYTYSGLFCVAINPYKRFPIYTLRAINIYKGKRRNEVPPHIFALADEAYHDMMANGVNQSILITGESGAGKTENTKKVITYFANVGATGKKKTQEPSKAIITSPLHCAHAHATQSSGVVNLSQSRHHVNEHSNQVTYLAAADLCELWWPQGNLEDQVVQTNPVLEAFGNAKTTRNDNSSRFGKFIRIHFGPLGKLAGADIETYLLEKARVISQGPLERSYHIFYQIMSGAIDGLLDRLLLSTDIYDYHYVSNGKTTVDSIDDHEEMKMTDTAFDVLNFSQQEKDNIYAIVASVMQLGEMKFKQKGREEQAEADGTSQAFDVLAFTQAEKDNIYAIVSSVMQMGTLKFKQRGREEQAEADGTAEGENVAKLLKTDGAELYKNLLKPRIKVGNDFVNQGRNKDQVYYSVGALAKNMYDRLFKWLVKKVNMTLDTKQKRASFIGVLDIFGFEIFDFNSFEQMCINFTNEKLQQFFNHHMFVLEQEEYKREEIDWVFMDFGMDLQACIDLMEKPMGVLSILEEESMFPKATDKTFEEKLKTNHLGKCPLFVKPKPAKPGQSESHFAIVHYAGTVNYNLVGWLEKNKDPLNDTVVDQFKKSGNALLVDLFADHPGQSAPKEEGGGGGKGGKRAKGSAFQTVSAMYREQLNNLMATLQATSPHFIRCIIPNETKSPGVIDSHLVMHQLTCNGVLEGIRICRKGFPNRLPYHDFRHRYNILATKEMEALKDGREACAACLKVVNLHEDKFRLGLTKVHPPGGPSVPHYKILAVEEVNKIKDDKEASAAILNKIELDQEKYRLGLTKAYPSVQMVFFRAGVLGDLEELRDDKLNMIFSWMQAQIRSYYSRREYEKLKEQRAMLLVVQRAIRKYMRLNGWPWFRLWIRVRPMLYETRIEDEIKKLKEEAEEAEANLDVISKARQESEENNVRLMKEKADLAARLEAERGEMGDEIAKQQKLQAQKADLESQLNDAQERLTAEEEERQKLSQEKRRMEQEISSFRKDLEEVELSAKKLDADKTARDHQIRTLNDEIAQQDELINKLNREKKRLQENQQKTVDDFGSQEDKVGHLLKVKAKLEQTLDELEDSLEREKKTRAEMDKAKRKVEGDLKLTQEAVADLEKNKRELEQTMLRKDREIAQLSTKLEEEQSLVTRLQRIIKELQGRIEELEEELESERQGRAKAEKQRADLARELEELTERLEEAGGATAAQMELNKKRENEIAKLRRDIEEQTIQQEATMAGLRRKHNDAITEMAEQIDQLNKSKAKADREGEHLRSETQELRSALDLTNNEKAAEEKQTKALQEQLASINSKLEEANRTLGDFDTSKKKLAMENSDLLHEVEQAESQVSQLQKLRSSLQSQLDECNRVCDEESRERATILGKYRNLEHDLDTMRESVDEEAESRSDLTRQVAKAQAECSLWRNKYEQEGVARAEELEEQRRKLAVRLQEATEQLEVLNQKNISLEKIKLRLTGEIDEMHVEVERAQQLAAQMEKKAKGFDKIIAEWKMKVDDVASELDASQRDCRNYSTELYRVRGAFDESNEQLEAVKRENKNLADEVKDLMDQIMDGGRSLAEVEKLRQRVEQEKEELQSALEEAETALEQEENKVLRGQLELGQARQEIERRIQEKEEEFENARRSHQRQMESMQASLEAEAKGRTEAMRMKKKLEQDITELEVAVERANVETFETQKNIKRVQNELRELQTQLEEEERSKAEVREALGLSERRANALHNELEETRTLLEQADRGRRQAEAELGDVQQQLSETEANYNSAAMARNKLEEEVKTLHVDLDEMLNEARTSEEKAKRAMIDAARLADELRAEQENAQQQEASRKSMEITVKDLTVRLDEAEANAVKNGRRIISKLEERLRSLESELDHEQRRHSDVTKNLRKADRRIKELVFQADEDKKNHVRMQDLVDSLQQKIKTYKRQIDEAEEIAALNLAKYRKCQQEVEAAEERCDQAESTLAKFRARGRGASTARGVTPAK
ncbi:Myosin heavy chain, muscle [Amphibalanus amphitrite]|uniref:Myosin heavy chain, muscle n=1 Tax=Amphibalanus amphitrite TaxID=1232801 RepID=A0A6A4WJ16_AMPAM|nr:Myosin heavy chain, muscle [Amphibalanus amphitrite]